ncbi:MAG: hypothetical protein V3T72_13180 [Thermoanaerobaculia bacterium]
MADLTLLGPQRRRPTIADAVDRLGVDGPVAAVTAGWREREGEDEEIAEHLGRPVTDLLLHRRAEQVFADDRALFEAHRERQNRLREMQQLYRYRLDFAIEPARELLRRKDDSELLEAEREAAIAAIRRLDEDHLRRIAKVHREFERRRRPHRRRAVREQRLEIAGVLERSAALVIAGGHVAVLINRLRLFGIADLAAEMPVIAWSAGAMALGERIVLFHDSPPWGAGNAEMLENGLGLYRGLLALPDAGRRLRLEDPERVALFARRFAPDLCLAFDDGAETTRRDGAWRPNEEIRRLTVAGEVRPLEAA